MRRAIYRLLGDATAYLCALGDTWGYWGCRGKGRWWHAPLDAVAYRACCLWVWWGMRYRV